MSLIAIARLMGCSSYSNLVRIENGTQLFRFETLFKLCVIYDISPVSLFNEIMKDAEIK